MFRSNTGVMDTADSIGSTTCTDADVTAVAPAGTPALVSCATLSNTSPRATPPTPSDTSTSCTRPPNWNTTTSLSPSASVSDRCAFSSVHRSSTKPWPTGRTTSMPTKAPRDVPTPAHELDTDDPGVRTPPVVSWKAATLSSAGVDSSSASPTPPDTMVTSTSSSAVR